MKVGFTGSREGMTDAQLRRFRTGIARLVAAGMTEFHHGCCVGADEQAAVAVRAHHPEVKIVGHPPTNDALVSYTALECCDERREPKPYLERNHNIVDETETLVATPRGEMFLRSGTWSTIRYATAKARRKFLVMPDATVRT